MPTLDELIAFPDLNDMPEEALLWLIERGEERNFRVGDRYPVPGAPAEETVFVMEGEFTVYGDPNNRGEEKPLFTLEEKTITGLLPFSRLTHFQYRGEVRRPLRMLFLHKDCYSEMFDRHPELMQRLVGLMMDRVRLGARNEQQQEKLAALGKLSAGLAHELNNPAAAIQRTADSLLEILHAIPRRVKAMLVQPPSPDQFDQLIAFVMSCKADNSAVELTMGQRGEIEDELEDWLIDLGLPDDEVFEMIEPLVEIGVRVEGLEKLAEEMSPELLRSALGWLTSTLAAKRMVAEIDESSERISELVGAIKSYSHMDKAGIQEPVDLREGLKSTITMLRNKLKGKKININWGFPEETPPVIGVANELNQVWTNLIDNAIDALPEGGTITLCGEVKGDFFEMHIIDDGPGVPEEIRARIFEPFYTTKSQGQGSGMGLDITQRIIRNHQGEIQLNSRSGETDFTVILPLARERIEA